MRIPNVLPRSLVLAALAAGLALSGCGDDDGGSGPTPSTEIDQATAQVQALQMLSFVDGMIASAGDVAGGDLTGLGATVARTALPVEPRGDACSGDPAYDAGSGSWNYVCSYADAGGSFAFNWFVQYLNGTTPQQSPDASTTSVSYGMDIDYDYSFSSEGTTATVDMTYMTDTTISGLQTDTYAVAGTGSSSGTVSGSDGTNSYNYVMDMSWTIDVTAPAAGGCASGSVTVTIGTFTMTATYDAGSQLYTWALTQGETVVASGSETSACTV